MVKLFTSFLLDFLPMSFFHKFRM